MLVPCVLQPRLHDSRHRRGSQERRSASREEATSLHGKQGLGLIPYTLVASLLTHTISPKVIITIYYKNIFTVVQSKLHRYNLTPFHLQLDWPITWDVHQKCDHELSCTLQRAPKPVTDSWEHMWWDHLHHKRCPPPLCSRQISVSAPIVDVFSLDSDHLPNMVDVETRIYVTWSINLVKLSGSLKQIFSCRWTQERMGPFY